MAAVEATHEAVDVPVATFDEHPRFVGVDLFCGGGGFSLGFTRALVAHYRDVIAEEAGLHPDDVVLDDPAVEAWLEANVLIVAVNHWDRAVETYAANHPWAVVHNAKVQALHPPAAITIEVDGELVTPRVDALIAGPSCIPWSKANGGMAKDDQLRMSPEHVKHWLYLLRPDQFLLENVEGFRKMGPIYIDNGERKMKKDGSVFDDWVGTLRTYGYTIDWETFYACDYGDPQSRKRLFVMGRLNFEPAWPTPTHGSDPGDDTEPYRTAAEIIDWSDPGLSLWSRDLEHPDVHTTLKYTTMQRVAEGIRRHCDDRLEPFADALEGIGRVTQKDVEDRGVDPEAYTDIETLREQAVQVEQAERVADRRDEPFLVEGPAPAIEEWPVSDDAENYGLCVPYILGQQGGAVARDATEEPVPAVATEGYIRLFQPETFVLPRNQRQRDHFSNGAYDPEDRPFQTVTAHNHDGHLVATTPYMIPYYGERDGQAPRTHDIEEPHPSVTATGSQPGLINPFLVEYYGQSTAADVEEPLPTVTTKDRHALIVPELYPWGLDLRYRMLQPRELALAQGFPEGYQFEASTKEDHTKLIGNAVPVNLAESLCRTLLEPTDTPTLNRFGDGPQPAAEEVADD